ncbi:MAG: enoyl-CoA hydratase/isomerase family protein [Oceanicaulis sp.]
MPEVVHVSREAGVRHLTLNRPELRNAMSLEMVEALLAQLSQAETEGDRMIVLRGAGGHFCSGGDIKDMGAAQAQPATDTDPVAEVNARFGALCAAYAETGLPVVCVVEGAVMGGGFGLACVADVVIASASAVFRLPETGLGLVPAQIAPFLVQRLGYSQARRLAVTGGKLDVEAALRLGLVHEVVSGEEALQTALSATVAQIKKGAPHAIAETKKLVRRARLEDPASLVADAAAVFARAARGPEGAEGMTAFLEKRKPGWAV